MHLARTKSARHLCDSTFTFTFTSFTWSWLGSFISLPVFLPFYLLSFMSFLSFLFSTFCLFFLCNFVLATFTFTLLLSRTHVFMFRSSHFLLSYREFYYIQMEKYARQAVSEGISGAENIEVTMDSELLRVLNLHYNRNNHIEVSIT